MEDQKKNKTKNINIPVVIENKGRKKKSEKNTTLSWLDSIPGLATELRFTRTAELTSCICCIWRFIIITRF